MRTYCDELKSEINERERFKKRNLNKFAYKVGHNTLY